MTEELIDAPQRDHRCRQVITRAVDGASSIPVASMVRCWHTSTQPDLFWEDVRELLELDVNGALPDGYSQHHDV